MICSSILSVQRTLQLLYLYKQSLSRAPEVVDPSKQIWQVFASHTYSPFGVLVRASVKAVHVA